MNMQTKASFRNIVREHRCGAPPDSAIEHKLTNGAQSYDENVGASNVSAREQATKALSRAQAKRRLLALEQPLEQASIIARASRIVR